MGRFLQVTGKLLAIVGPTVTLIWGFYTYIDARRFDARKPFLEYQLALYKETASLAVQLALSQGNPNSTNTTNLRMRFEQLYWGELALVENREVSSAMVVYRRALDTNNGVSTNCLNLAHAMRRHLAESWNVADWKEPAK